MAFQLLRMIAKGGRRSSDIDHESEKSNGAGMLGRPTFLIL
jgi:hypothetical protein